MQRYRSALDRALAAVGDHPEPGRPINAGGLDLRALHVEHHVISYRIGTDASEVVRIPHERRDAWRRLRSGRG